MADVEKLIDENRRSRSPTLDLGKCDLGALPAALAQFGWLEKLVLGNNPLSDLSALAGLRRLRELNVQDTQVADLSPLIELTALENLSIHNTRVSSLAPLRTLRGLQTLFGSNIPVVDLSPLAGLTQLQSLFLWKSTVADIEALRGLVKLVNLSINGTAVADLSPLIGLPELQRLEIDGTPIDRLNVLAGLTTLAALNISQCTVEDLSPLARLTGLKALMAWGTPVADLTPLAALDALETIFISGSKVENLAPLAGLQRLQRLDVTRSLVRDLTPLANLRGLKHLDVGHTAVDDLTAVAQLPNLRWLSIADTQVSDLAPLRTRFAGAFPVTWSSFSLDDDALLVENCPLVNPPVEIARQGNEAILNYFAEQDVAGVDRLYEAKLLILGEGGAGKTSLLRRLFQPGQPLPAENESTHGIAVHRHDFTMANGRRFRLNVWDFGGQEIYHATHQFFLTRRSLYVLLDDSRKDNQSVSHEGFKYWLDLIELFGDNSPVLIFQNQKGRSKTVDFDGIQRRYDIVKRMQGGDLARPDAADALRADIEHFASTLNHVGEALPARWLKVRADIEARAADVPYITQHEYFALYERHLPADRSKALHLSRYLHDLGVFLHFQDHDLLRRFVILQNGWATAAVFRMLDDDAVRAAFGRFGEADCARLWHDPQYVDMHPELLALMQHFELCYVLTDIQPKTYLAPQLLPPARPAALHDWARADDQVLRYRYESFMPKGLLSRLTVRLHRYVLDPGLACVSAVLFEHDRTQVLAELLPSGRAIELRARGPERTGLLSVVAADLDALNQSFPGLRDKVDRHIPCLCVECRASTQPHFFAWRQLVKRRDAHRTEIDCEQSLARVDVMALLDGVRVDGPPRWEAQRPGLLLPAERTIRVFLASSNELAADRDAFELHVRQRNDVLKSQGIYLSVTRWENFLDAMSPTRLQSEYNKAAAGCDVFVSLFGSKVGRFTEEEFDSALRQFRSSGRPRIFTFFKGDVQLKGISPADLQSLAAFQIKLEQLGHYQTGYDNIDSLKLRFQDQLERLLATDDGPAALRPAA